MLTRNRKIVILAVMSMMAVGLIAGAAFAATQGTPVAGTNSQGCGNGAGNGSGYRWGAVMAGNNSAIRTEVAKALGMSTEDLQKELDSGKTCAEVAQSKGISTEKLAEIVKKAKTDLLDKAVAEGRVTEEQAKVMKDRIADCTGNGCGSGNRGNGRGLGDGASQ